MKLYRINNKARSKSTCENVKKNILNIVKKSNQLFNIIVKI